jgi:uncharacterized protein (DUF488 family)
MIRTVGHGTLAADDFTTLVRSAGLDVIVDVRRFPGSRRHPQFGASMPAWLADGGIGYQWIGALGGRRTAAPDTPNIGLRNPQFRGYADHMATAEFVAGVSELVNRATAECSAVMCAESVWWRCHRRLLADHLVLVEKIPVEHLFHDGRLVAHEPAAEARRVGDRVVYDVAGQPTLFES